MLALRHGFAIHRHRPLLPADIVAELGVLPEPRILVTTPIHLRGLMAEEGRLPSVSRIISANAPLHPGLAAAAEERFGAPLYEIYGCSEIGQMAARRTVETAEWQCLDGIELEQRDGEVWARGPAAACAGPLNDLIDLRTPNRFFLLGRKSDMINIAGKRTSLGYLNHHLNSIAHVEDGSFFCPSAMAGASVERLCAFVVAPRLTPAQLLSELRQRIEPVFLPRPLLFLERLPRNDTGKLPTADLQNLLDNYRNGLAPPLPGGQS